MNVAILGASDRPDRYAYKALKSLKAHGHNVFLVNPQLKEVEGIPVVPHLKDIKEKIDTVTMYVGPRTTNDMIPEIVAFKPRRVVFNPGSENADLIAALKESGVHVVEACTLVMLSLNQFETA